VVRSEVGPALTSPRSNLSRALLICSGLRRERSAPTAANARFAATVFALSSGEFFCETEAFRGTMLPHSCFSLPSAKPERELPEELHNVRLHSKQGLDRGLGCSRAICRRNNDAADISIALTSTGALAIHVRPRYDHGSTPRTQSSRPPAGCCHRRFAPRDTTFKTTAVRQL
jgi:hypothetical protein